MKIKLIIILCFISVIFGQGLTYTVNPGGDPTTVESALGGANLLTYRAYADTISYNNWEHKYRTASHEYADSTTYYRTVNDSVFGGMSNPEVAIATLNANRTYLVAHMALDSCHNGAADATTVIPTARTYTSNTTSDDIKEYADSLKLAQTSHFGRTISTRYKLLGKEFTSDFIAHCAKDTSDAADVHWFPDTLYNTVTFDSTNTDSVLASVIRLKGRFNSHIADTGFHGTYLNADSILTANPTTYAGIYDAINELRTNYNTHAVRDTSATDSVHMKADTGLITTAAVVPGNGHIAADTGTLTGLAYTCYNLSDYSRFAVYIVASSVSSGASIYIAGSPDNVNYAIKDSVVVTANGLQPPKIITDLYKYIKIYCDTWTDGAYKVQLLSGGK